MESVKFLIMARELTPTKSDYALAKMLDITPGGISLYMAGKRVMNDTTALKLAKILEIDPMQIIAAANADRESGENQQLWKNFYERLGGVAASIFFFAVTMFVTPTPSEAAPVLKPHSEQCILCKIIEPCCKIA